MIHVHAINLKSKVFAHIE